MTPLVLPTSNLTQLHPIPGVARRDLYLTGGPTATPGQVLAWFNASSVTHKGKRWMAYRTECKKWFLWSRINLVQLDADFMPIQGTNKLLDLHTRFDGWGAEDPRMFVFKGEMYISYGDGYRMLLAKLNEKGDIIRQGGIPSDIPDYNPPQGRDREKNWGFFEFEGRLFCQQNVSPVRTFEFDPDSWTVKNEWDAPWRWSSVYGMRLNGGAPPVFHNGLLWRWVHTHRTETLPEPRKAWWSNELQKTGNRYYPFLAAFKPEPPFEPVAITEEPVFYSDWDSFEVEGPTHYSVTYVGSSERENDGWRIFYGENDRRIVTTHVNDKEAESTLVEVKANPARPRKRPARNALHFVWMQGPPPAEDESNIGKWRAMNPDWDVMVWDDDTLTRVISDRAPAWVKTWQTLKTQRGLNPFDTALIAKASDLARLILLSIRFNGEQTWNAYADTDTTPHRPLTEFLNDDVILGSGFGKSPNMSGLVTERPWDSDDYDLIISQENLLYPQADKVTNAVMLARPGAFAITAVLKAGEFTRNRPTLKAFGPMMLKDTIENLKRTTDGQRIEVLPFHYLVWNQKQMASAKPDWTVCSHHNKFRWHQPGVRTANAGASTRRGTLA